MNLILLLLVGLFFYVCFFVCGARKYLALFVCTGLIFFAIFLFDGGTRVHHEDTNEPGAPRTLRFLMLEGVIPHEIYKQLEKDTGISIEAVTYTNHRDFDEIIQSGQEFDIALLTDYIALRMKRLGHTVGINYKNVPNVEMISPRISGYKPFSPLFDCSVPYLFHTLSIGYNRFHFDDLPLSWRASFDDALLADMRGHIALNDDMRNMLGIFLKIGGSDPNSVNPDEVRAAGRRIMTIMDASLPYVTASGNDELLIDESVYIGVACSSEMTHAMEVNPQMRFANADEGAVVFLECFSIMKNCQDKATAYEFINYMYRPKVAAKVTNTTYYASLNDAAKPYVRPEILNSPSYFFPENDSVIIRADLVEGEEIYEEVWAEVMSYYEKVIVPQREELLFLDF